MKKRKVWGCIAAFLAVLLLCCACRVDRSVMLLYYSLGGPFSSRVSVKLTEPEYVEHAVCRMRYEELGENQRLAYRLVYNAIPSHPQKILLPALSEEELTEVMAALRWENPQILCFDASYTFYTVGRACWLLPEYAESAECCRARTGALLARAKEIVNSIPENAGCFEAELCLHDAICGACDYAAGEWANDAYGALVNGHAVCGGYTAAAKLLFDMAGLTSAVVSGTARDVSGQESHIWNAVLLEDGWYYTDVTWDDPVASGEVPAHVSRAYFNVSGAELEKTHADFKLPAGVQVTGGDENYFIKNGLYCSEDNWRAVLENALGSAIGGSGEIEVKFASLSLFRAAMQVLFSGGGLQTLLQPFLENGPLKCTYSGNDDVCVLHILLQST